MGLQSMISAKLAEEADEMENEEDMPVDELDSSDLGSGDNAEPSDDASDSSDIENDDELMAEEDDDAKNEEDDMKSEEEGMENEMAHEGDDMENEMYEEEDEDDLDLESVIAELEAEMVHSDEAYHEEEEMDDMKSEEDDMEAEEDDMKNELEEAYSTIESLQKTINEVNLLNAKLLYTNKLFRTFDLNENQKVKVLENFDRTSSVREVKLVFSTLAENLNVSKKKRTVVKEGYASKATKSSAPKKIISEGNELSARWKKLAGL